MKRPLFWFALSFLGATAAFFASGSLLPRLLGAALVWLFCAAACRGGRRGAVLLLAASLLAIGYAQARETIAQRRFDPLVGQTVTGTLAVEEVEPVRGGFRLSGHARIVPEGGRTLRMRVALIEFGDLSADPGEPLSFEAVFRSQRGGEASLVCERIVETGPAAPQPAAALAALRKRVAAAAGEAVYGEARGVLIALLTGDRTALAGRTVRNFRTAGMSHLLVVSGMHLCLVASAVHALPLKRRRLRAALALGLVWAFALFTGLGVSAVRAALLLTMAQAARFFSRRGDPITSLGFACLAIVLVSPRAVQSVSFQLSVGSTLGIVLLADRFARAIGGRLPRLFAPLAQPFSISLAAQIGVLPILALSFGSAPVVGLAANLFAVPLLTPILFCGAAAVAIAPLRFLLGALCRLLLLLLCAIARIAAGLPFAQIGIGERWELGFLFGVYALAVLCAVLRPGAAFLRRLAVPLSAAFAVCLCIAAVGSRLCVTANLLPQDGVVLLLRGQRAVVLGCPRDRWAADRAASLLRRQNVRAIECLWTDGDLTLSAVALGEEFPISAVAAPDTPQNRSLCRTAGLSLCEIAPEARLLGCVEASFSPDATIFLGEGDPLCQIGPICVIMEKNPRTLPPLDESAIRLRIRRLP